MLDDDVAYHIGDRIHRGPEAVVDSYRDGSRRARSIFERVEYSHQIVDLVGTRTVRIDFVDVLHVHGEQLDHHSVQDIELGPDGRVVSITDLPVEGQRQRVDAFLARHGMTRDGND